MKAQSVVGIIVLVCIFATLTSALTHVRLGEKLQSPRVPKVFGLNKAANEKAHRTDMYRGAKGTAPQPNYVILRRCADFVLDVPEGFGDAPSAFLRRGRYSASYSSVDDKLKGRAPTVIGGGKNAIPLTLVKYDKTTRKATFNHNAGGCNEASIGRFLIEVVAPGASEPQRINGQFLFLFNPMSSFDDVYVPRTTEYGLRGPSLEDHVFTEEGAVWRGSANQNAPYSWAYNQFDLLPLTSILDILEADLSDRQLANVVLVARWMTEVIHRDILEGKWPSADEENPYADGQSPMSWVDTTAIIQKYAAKKNKNIVRYGQCWVFASVTTTLGRTLGIATRSVTNFDSAHESKPFDQICDVYWKNSDKAGYIMHDEAKNKDRIWNFHVWNDMWFKFAGNTDADGWQAVDATLQEYSTGPSESPFNQEVGTCGPAPLALMRKGIYKEGIYDTAFVGGETNCVVIDHFPVVGQPGKYSQRVDKVKVGKFIKTLIPYELCERPEYATNPLCVADSNPSEELNVAQDYSKPGTFLLLELHDKLTKQQQYASDFRAYLAVTNSNNKNIVAQGATERTMIGSPLVLSLKVKAATYPIIYQIQIAAVSAVKGKFRAPLLSVNATAQTASDEIQFAFSPSFWGSALMQKALSETFEFRAIISATDAAHQATFHHKTFAFDTRLLDLECAPVSVGEVLKCQVQLDSATISKVGFTRLSKVKLVLSVSSQTQPAATTTTATTSASSAVSVLSFDTLDISKNHVFEVGMLINVRPTSGRIGAQVVLTSAELIPLQGSLVNIKIPK